MENIFFLNIPIQMISCTNTDGRIIPLKFKFKNKDGSIVTVFIKTVLSSEKNQIGIRYVCTADISGSEKSFTLWHSFYSHDWKLTQVNS